MSINMLNCQWGAVIKFHAILKYLREKNEKFLNCLAMFLPSLYNHVYFFLPDVLSAAKMACNVSLVCFLIFSMSCLI